LVVKAGGAASALGIPVIAPMAAPAVRKSRRFMMASPVDARNHKDSAEGERLDGGKND